MQKRLCVYSFVRSAHLGWNLQSEKLAAACCWVAATVADFWKFKVSAACLLSLVNVFLGPVETLSKLFK